ncbi:hypothetical protein NIES37_08170 [Tolypothrix tenuis PCC 7101]|uniref:Uncharacterized protein n=1 Tax=Tolypothrix tenuis PCC 7101 TaxID=231146 RepID=A0A1Z4MTS2_9CYAN|nr:hypothetical protein [Aulosira sp. FACHB-113]BAY96880.1 hypothetical protein NIES37_08170 [Tolypothrix tenuis PCC 7101]BAZ72612.1 hypothetical protein NIES50_11660 [Aulosira laxa NIES-50]
MTFARIFIANHIDKIHTLSNESALLFKGDLGGSTSLKDNTKMFSEIHSQENHKISIKVLLDKLFLRVQ